MKKIVFFICSLCLLLLSLTLSGCKKESSQPTGEGTTPQPPATETDVRDAFVGTYDLEIVTDSVQNNGTWFANSTLPATVQIPTRNGRLTITKAAKEGVVDVLGRILLAGDSVDYYRTTGMVDSTGTLTLNPGNDFTSGTTGITYHFNFYTPLCNPSPIQFRVDASYTANQTSFINRSTNTATRQ